MRIRRRRCSDTALDDCPRHTSGRWPAIRSGFDWCAPLVDRPPVQAHLASKQRAFSHTKHCMGTHIGRVWGGDRFGHLGLEIRFYGQRTPLGGRAVLDRNRKSDCLVGGIQHWTESHQRCERRVDHFGSLPFLSASAIPCRHGHPDRFWSSLRLILGLAYRHRWSCRAGPCPARGRAMAA